VKRIEAYMEDNFYKYDFSLQKMAEDFNMSLSNISHYFKNHTGRTLSNYLICLKIEEAKKLLRETDLNLENISEKIGYINLSSFIRKFKNDTGITPGEYRMMHK
jgi:YesN/AraC family two-component response regulator